MADITLVKISALPAAEQIGAEDLLPVVQEGATKAIAYGVIKDDIANELAPDATLSEAGKAADAKAVGDALALKADKTELTAEVSRIDAALATKANTNDVNAALATKANTDDVTAALALKADTATVNAGLSLKADKTELTAGLATKQNVLTFDSTPTQGSTNPVTSGGIYQAIPALDDTLTVAGDAADAKITGDEITELKNEIDEITGPDINLLYHYAWTPSGASIVLNNDNITVTATSASTYRGAYVDIPVNGSNFMTLSYLSKSASVESATAARIRYGSVVDGTNTWINYITSSPAVINTSNITTLRIMLYVDSAAVAVGDYAVFTQLQIEYGESASSFSSKLLNAVDNILRREVSELTNEIPLMLADSISTVGANKYNPDTRVVGFINADTGTINPNTDYFTSDFIDVSEFAQGYAFTPKARKILFYDENKNAIQDSYHTNETAAGVLTLDASYKYIRLSWYRTSSNVMVADASEIPPYEPYEIVAKNGINYLNADTDRAVREIIGVTGKYTEIAAFLNGKTIAVFGDSIMHGAGNNDNGIADLFADKYGMIPLDYSVSGATMGVRTDDPDYTVDEVHHIAKQIRNAIAAGITPDIIVFDGGANDIGGNIPIGTMTEVYTVPAAETYFADGFETAAYLLKNNFVGVPIIYMRAHNMSSRSYTGQVDYGELGNRIAEKWGIRNIDMYKRMNTQLAGYRTAYLADYTHPNAAGYEKYYIPALEDFIFRELV